MVKWTDYQTKPPSKEQLDKWFKDKTLDDTNIAIVLGEASHGLCVVDFDNMLTWKQVDGEYYEQNNLVAISGSGKRHLYIMCNVPTRKYRIAKYGIDIQASGGIIIAPPSIHPSGGQYRFIDKDAPPLVVRSVETFVDKMLKRDTEEIPEPKPNIPIQTLKEVRPCIQALMDCRIDNAIGKEDHGLGHEARMAVANEGFALGWDDDKITRMFSTQKDYDYSYARYQVTSLRKSWIGRPWGCKKLKAKGWCPGECHSNP